MLVLDAAWIGLFMGPRYGSMVARIQGAPLVPHLPSACIAYICMCVGLCAFVLAPHRASVSASAFWGMCYGLVLFGVYDATCSAVFAGWDRGLAVVDVAWGGVLCAAAAAAGAMVSQLPSSRPAV